MSMPSPTGSSASLGPWRRLLAASLLVLAPAVAAQPVTASLWSELGPNSASSGGISNSPNEVLGAPAIAIDPNNGDIYVAWTADNDDIYVRRWDGSLWTEVGAGSASGGGVSQSPGRPSESPRLAVRAGDSHVFLVWREVADDAYSASDVHAAEFDGTQWQWLGNVSANGGDAHVRHVLGPDIVLSSVFASQAMPIVAWNALADFQGGDAVYVKRWTGLSWVEMGAGSAGRYAWPGVFPDGRTVHARGINADDAEVIRFYADGSSDAGGMLGGDYYHYSSCCVRLALNPLGRPVAIFRNGKTRDGIVQYPYGIHVRSFIGDNSLPAYQAWAETGRSLLGQSAGGDETLGRDLDLAGVASGYALHLAATVIDDATGDGVLRVLKFTGNGWSSLGALDVAGDAAWLESAFWPSIETGGDGNLVLAWMRETDDGTNYDIHVLRTANVGGAFAWAEFGGGSATANGISNNPSLSGYPALVLDRRGGNDVAVVAWQDGDTPDNAAAQIYARGAQAAATPLPVLSIADITVVEGDRGVRTATFTVGLSQPAGAGGVSLSIVTGPVRGAGNAAQAGSDYPTSGPLPVLIPFGQTSATFAVKVFGDMLDEPDEVFGVYAIAVTGATVPDGAAVGLILDDDPSRPKVQVPACRLADCGGAGDQRR